MKSCGLFYTEICSMFYISDVGLRVSAEEMNNFYTDLNCSSEEIIEFYKRIGGVLIKPIVPGNDRTIPIEDRTKPIFDKEIDIKTLTSVYIRTKNQEFIEERYYSLPLEVMVLEHCGDVETQPEDLEGKVPQQVLIALMEMFGDDEDTAYWETDNWCTFDEKTMKILEGEGMFSPSASLPDY